MVTLNIVKEDESLQTAIDKALKRSPEDIYDEIIVTDDKGFDTCQENCVCP